MKIQDAPDAATTLEDLAAFLDLCWAALEDGVREAANYFSAMNRSVDDLGLAAHLTRYKVKVRLDRFETEFEREALAFSGLLVRLERNGRLYVVRIRRSPDGTPPFPETVALREFYRQPKPQYLPGLEPTRLQERRLPETHLMLLWSTPADYSRVSSVAVCCPKSVGEEAVHVHWTVEAPHPIASIVVLREAPAAEDLKIERIAVDAEQGGA